MLQRALYYCSIMLSLIVSYYLLFRIADRLFPISMSEEYSTTILARDGQLLHSFLTSDDKWRMYTELDEITPELEQVILFKEDKYFYYHPGVNVFAILRALYNNVREGRRTSGASTVTMQVARLIDPKERSYCNKLIEIFRAFQLEHRYTKREILQLYLNRVPYGGNIEGVKSASVIYLNKLPNHLSLAEITALSIIPNRPVSLYPGRNNSLIEQERNKWLQRLHREHLFSPEAIEEAIHERFTAYRNAVPREAPHLSYRLKNQHTEHGLVHTTIHTEIQRKAEQLVGNYSRNRYFQGIRNATAIIIDNSSCQVLAYVGSADFHNAEDGGQVDGIRATRSPGSTLKPFLYGLAMDAGLITPKTIVSDVPTSFGGYEPENYDEKFRGPVSIEEALASSLNIPAVKVLDELGTGTFLQVLARLGFQQIARNKNHLGLSAVLGGCDTSLEQLSALYTSFANQGIYHPLNYLLRDSVSEGTPILSPSSTYMLTEVLTQLARPDLPVSWENSKHTPKIAWKTGTSYGRKDAWSIGYNSRYTIGVWLGNFSGQGVPGLNGAETATPLLFQLFNALDNKPKNAWFSAPNELQMRYVCAQSGKLSNHFCDDLILDFYIPCISSNELCNHLRELRIAPDSSCSYCTSCAPATGYKKAYYSNLSPEMITYYLNHSIPYNPVPPHYAHCNRLLSGSAPEITSPIDQNEYFVNVADSMQIKLSCHAALDVEKVFWYINDKHFQSAPPGKAVFILPTEGKLRITCTDDKGRNSTVQIVVKHSNF